MHAESERDIGGERPCGFFRKMKERLDRFREESNSFAAQSVLAKYHCIEAPAEPIVVDDNESHSEETADLGSLVKAGMLSVTLVQI